MLLAKLSQISLDTSPAKESRIYTYLHQIAEKIKRRSLVFLFTDMFQSARNEDKLFDALRHLKYNKHEVIIFHLLDRETEFHFNFENSPKRYLDVETGQYIDLYADQIKDAYQEGISEFIETLKLRCAQYKIKYVEVDIREKFHKVLNTFMIERQGFV